MGALGGVRLLIGGDTKVVVALAEGVVVRVVVRGAVGVAATRLVGISGRGGLDEVVFVGGAAEVVGVRLEELGDNPLEGGAGWRWKRSVEREE